jgi:hypothetical protein
MKSTRDTLTLDKKIENFKKVNMLIKKLKDSARKRILEKHQTDKDFYNIRIVNDIIYNEKAHIVASFKDYLIFDDTSEFLRRYYKVTDIKQRLLKIFEFYESFSKIFANYIILPEAKYLYKNIQRKQKMIDNQQRLQNQEEENKNQTNQRIFDTEVYDSIMNQTNTKTNVDECNVTTSSFLIYRDMKVGNDISYSVKESTVINKDKDKDKETSYNSLEFLIDSIGKAEKNFVTITSTGSTTDKKSSLQSLLNSKSLKPQPSPTINNNLLTKVKEKEKNEITSKIATMKETQKHTPIMTKKHTKVIIASSGERNSKNLLTSNPNSNQNTIIGSISINNQQQNQDSKMNTLNINQGERIISTHSPNPMTQSVEQKGKNGFISHKNTLSMPKLTNNIYNNYNIINNYQSAIQPTQINIFTSSQGNVGNILESNTLINTLVSSLNQGIQNSQIKIDGKASPSPLKGTHNYSNSATFIKNQGNYTNLSSNMNSNSTKETKSQISNIASNQGVLKNDMYKYIKTYTNDLNKIKKKVVNLVNDNQSQNQNVKHQNSYGAGAKIMHPNSTISALNTINVNNSQHNLSQSAFKRGESGRQTSLTARYNDREGNSLRAMIHKNLFDGVNIKEEKVSTRKGKVENTKVLLNIKILGIYKA